ncbi:MAG TPA: Bax inhibitor-1/YccA family protein [Vicinamibacteria bacterium]
MADRNLLGFGRSGNPALGESAFRGLAGTGEGVMTLQGTVNKTGLSLLIVLAGAAITWNLGNPGLRALLVLGGALGGLVLALIISFKKTAAPYLTPVYAFLEGLLLGGVSAMYQARYEGIVILAVGLTLGTMAALLAAYSARLIRATENFKLGVFAATGGIALLYLVSMVMGIFGARIPYIHESGPIGIGFSLVVVVIAALNLVLDFDFIERGSASGAPKYMEWYGAFGLLVTLIWLYLELLRLLSKIMGKSRR